MSNHLGIGEAVRDACLRAALEAYESAGISGLCHEGRWEVAVQAIRGLDLQPIVGAISQEPMAVAPRP